MNWINLDSERIISDILQLSKNEKVLIFKYSPRCVINYLVKKLFEKEYITGEMKMKTYLLDVINNKLISQLIEKTFEVIHQSPQIIIVSNLKPVYTASHGRVLYSEIKKYSN